MVVAPAAPSDMLPACPVVYAPGFPERNAKLKQATGQPGSTAGKFGRGYSDVVIVIAIAIGPVLLIRVSDEGRHRFFRKAAELSRRDDRACAVLRR